MKKFKKDLVDFFLEEILFTFVLVSIIVAIVVYSPWAIYKIAAGIEYFLIKNIEIPIVLYGIGIYSTFTFPKKMILVKKTQIRLNTIITTIVSVILLFICVEFWWVIPLLGILISITCIKNKYTGVEIEECFAPEE